MNRFLRNIVVACVALLSFGQLHAQENVKLLVGADYDMLFDNREYYQCQFGESQTLFSSRLTPRLGVEWNKYNSLNFGMDLWSDFGNNTVTFTKARPQIYYQFDSEKVAAYAGIFPREKMMGDYTDIMVSDSLRFYDNRLQGVMGQYKGDRGFAEISADWCGKYSEESREKFRIMSAGRFYIDNYHRRFYAGYNFSMYHFAGSKLIRNCVNDQLMLDPYVGARFNAFLDFDIKLHYIQTFQRDRDNDEKYLRPKGGMLQVRMSKWGIYLDEQLYLGENLQPYYRTYRSEEFPSGYGGELYGGESFYSTTENIYNITKIGYDRTFFSNTLRVNCYFAMQYDGTGWGNKQIVSVSVRLLKDVALSKK